MLRRFWVWLMGPAEPNPLFAVMEQLLLNQERANSQTFEAIQAMNTTSQKQAEVMQSYLKLFTPNTADAARNGWREGEEKEDIGITHPGFPKDGSEAEQAEWVLAHLDETL